MAMENKFKFLTSFHLKVLAMALMFCDHLWATLISGELWLTCLGRIAFPIFAFQIAEGFIKTRNFKKYIGRLFLFALISEVPFNLMASGTIFFPFHQNVMFTFVLALVMIRMIQWGREKNKFCFALMILVALILSSILGIITMVDYFHYGIIMVIFFYLFRGMRFEWLWQLIMMYIINVDMMQGMWIDQSLFGFQYQIPLQGYALFALIPIWLYNGKKGRVNTAFQYFVYAFYPLHMLVLSLIALIS